MHCNETVRVTVLNVTLTSHGITTTFKIIINVSFPRHQDLPIAGLRAGERRWIGGGGETAGECDIRPRQNVHEQGADLGPRQADEGYSTGLRQLPQGQDGESGEGDLKINHNWIQIVFTHENKTFYSLVSVCDFVIMIYYFILYYFIIHWFLLHP